MTTPSITQSDLKAGVEMGKLSDGYFSDTKTAQAFIDIGLGEVLPQHGNSVNLVSFGGAPVTSKFGSLSSRQAKKA